MKIFLLLFISFNVFAGEIEFDTKTENTIEIQTFKSIGENLIIYLPNYRGLGEQYPKWAKKLVKNHIDTWVLDLHNSYMLTKTKSSMAKFKIADIVEIVDFAYAKGFKKLYFISSGSGVKIALKTAYLYQKKYQNNPQKSNFIKGHIFHSPNLLKTTPKIGESAQYSQISKHSNLPVYMIMSDKNTKFARQNEIITTLKTGGSVVFSQIVKGVSAGFFVKNNHKLTNKGILARNKLNKTYLSAIKLINFSEKKPLVVFTENHKKNAKITLNTKLQKINKLVKSLILSNLNGEMIDLKNYKNKVVLLNFWASWCKPCVREIPSLLRLKQKINNPNFVILAVNIGDNKTEIIKFKQKLKREQSVDFNLPILLDENSTAALNWKVYAYPSNYIIDKNFVIKYGYSGALEWDSEDIINTIKELL